MLNFNFGYIVSLILYIILLFIGIKKRLSPTKLAVYSLFYIYLIGFIKVTLFPIPIQKEVLSLMAKDDFIKNNFIPFKFISDTVKSGHFAVRPIVGNILLFMPLGYLLPILNRKVSTLGRVVTIGLLSSIGIESFQAILSLIIGVRYKISDIDDLILNTTGAIIGFFLLKLTRKWLERIIDFSHLDKKSNLKLKTSL